MLALDHPAACCNRSGAYKLRLRGSLGQPIRKYETNGFFDSHFAGRDPAFFQSFRDQLVRALVFLPDAQVEICAIRSLADLLVSAVFLESRTHVESRTLSRKNERKHALTAPPAHPGEVAQRRAFHQQNRSEPSFRHQLARLLLALRAFFARDRSSLGLSRLELCDRRGKGSRVRGDRRKAGQA